MATIINELDISFLLNITKCVSLLIAAKKYTSCSRRPYTIQFSAPRRGQPEQLPRQLRTAAATRYCNTFNNMWLRSSELRIIT